MTTENVSVRAERPSDRAAIRAVNERAFAGRTEADLMVAPRADRAAALSLVACRDESDEAVIGHILFSLVTVDAAEGGWRAIALGPMAVDPPFQRRGVGSQLVRSGLEGCGNAGHDVVFVLGHPEFYTRFGFVPAAPLGLRSQWPQAQDAFMVAERSPGALRKRHGLVRYHPAFEMA